MTPLEHLLFVLSFAYADHQARLRAEALKAPVTLRPLIYSQG